MRRLLTAIFLLALGVLPARAATVDFGSPPATFTSYTESGITFTAVGGGPIHTEHLGPNGTPAIVSAAVNTLQELRADIGAVVDFVSVQLGDFGADADLLFLDVFDAADNLLVHEEALLPSGFSGMIPLSASSSGIAYAVFGSRAPSVGGSSVYADNFTASFGPPAPPVSPVPLPGSLPVMAVALAAAAWVGRRRRPAAGAGIPVR